MSSQNGYSLAAFLIETESRNTQEHSKKKLGGDGKQWPLTPFLFPAPWPDHRPAIETPPRPDPAGPSFHDSNASCSQIPPRASRNSLPPRH